MKKQVVVAIGLLALMAAEGGVVRTPLDGVGTAESWKYRNGEKQRISADGTAEDIRLFALPAARSAAVKALEKLL